MHLLQLTNQPISEAGRTMIDALKSCFNNDVKVWTDAEISHSQYPSGTIDVSKKTSLTLPSLKRKRLKAILSQIPEGETVILTDWFSLSLFSSKMLKSHKVVHLIAELPPSKILYEILKTYSKKKNQFFSIVASQTIKEALHKSKEELGVIQIAYPPYFELNEGAKSAGRQSFIIGIVSKLENGLGIETLIQTLHRCEELLPQVNIIIVGDGPEKRRLLWLIDHLHLRRRVQIVATQQNYIRFLANFDILVAPNPNETGWDPVIINALAQGLPVVACKNKTYSEIIETGQNGLLFERGNSHMLAQHIINLYNNPDWMEHYKKTGPQLVRNRYSFDKFKSAISEIL